MKWLNLSCCLIASCGFVGGAYAISNPGFETGDLSQWIVNGSASAVTGHEGVGGGDGRIYTAQEGFYFARLVTGLGPSTYTTLSQTFHLNSGQTISGLAAFDAGDSLPYNDDAYVGIQGPNVSTTLWTASVDSVGDEYSSPWQGWNFTATEAGSYTITLAVANSLDNGFDSFALFDVFGVSDIGSTCFLLGGNLIGLIAMRRKFLS